jgi:hypothetical protein
MIYKLQLALFSMEKNPPILAYSEGRMNQMQISMTPELKKMFGPKLKIYVEAGVVGKQLHVSEVVADRRW